MPKDLLTAAWKLLLLRGVLGIVLGVVLVVWPQATITVLMVLVGIWALVDGIGLAAQAFAKGATTQQRALFVDVDPRARWLSPLLSGVPLPEPEPEPDPSPDPAPDTGTLPATAANDPKG